MIKLTKPHPLGLLAVCPSQTREGVNDTTSLDKTVTAVVTASFALR